MNLLHPSYLGVSSTQYIDHDLHDSLVHAQSSHEVGMLIKHLVVHDVTTEEEFNHHHHPSKSHNREFLSLTASLAKTK